jgi:hypothetical protein
LNFEYPIDHTLALLHSQKLNALSISSFFKSSLYGK